MKKIRPELKRIEGKMKSARSTEEKIKVITDEYEGIRPSLDIGLGELDRIMKKFAFESGAQNAKFNSRVKPLKSVISKVIERGKNVATMADFVGGMILVDTAEEARAIYDRIKRKYADLVIGAEEKAKNGKDVLGYHGSFHVDVLLKGTDLVGELQIMTKKLATYKDPAHDIYTKYRDAGKNIRNVIKPEDANQSRKFFNMGNKPGRLREFVEQLLEWVGNFQRGGTTGNRTNARDDKKFTKHEELEMADQSPIFRKYMSRNGWKFQTTVHAGARAFQRRLEFEFAQWKLMHDRVAEKLDGFTRWKKGDNYLLFYSRSLEQAYIVQVYPDQKTLRIITVLPKGRNSVPSGTGKVLVESVGMVEVETIDLEDAPALTPLNEALITVGKQAYPKFGAVVIVAGGGGSGKGFVLSNLLGVEGKILDVDAMKLLTMKTPGVVAKVKKEFGVDISKLDLKTPEDVGKLHMVLKDAGVIDKKDAVLYESLLRADASRKPNVIFDVTMKDQKKFVEVCEQMISLGYHRDNIHLVWVVNDLNVALKQNSGRDRVVPEDILKMTHVGASTTMLNILRDTELLGRNLGGDIVFAFNNGKVDAVLKKSDNVPDADNKVKIVNKKDYGVGQYIVKANYVYVKRQGRPVASVDALGREVIKKIVMYTPAKKEWGEYLK